MTKTSRLLLVLTLCVFAMFGVAMAADPIEIDMSKGTLTINENTYSHNGSTVSYTNGTPFELTGTCTNCYVSISSGVSANLILNNVSITSNGAGIYIPDGSTGDVTITIADGTTNTIKGGRYGAGIQKDDGTGTLTINGGTKGTGVLNVIGGAHSAGIGGSYMSSTANIQILGGIINATGGSAAAGIGSGGYSSELAADNITIKNATVTAIGTDGGAGIGAGPASSNGYSNASTIYIEDSVVLAKGSGAATGIGASANGDCYDISIRNSLVTAYGGTSADYDIGANTDNDWTCESVLFERSSVKATVATYVVDASNEVVTMHTIPNVANDKIYINNSLFDYTSHSIIESGDTNLYPWMNTTYTYSITPTITKPTAVSDLKYTGKPQELISAGSTTGGTLVYRIGTTGEWSTSIPTATDAGTYLVYYKVLGDDVYSDLESTRQRVAVTIMEAIPVVTPPTAITGLKYTGEPQALINPGYSEHGTLYYGIVDEEGYVTYSADIPVATESGTYEVMYRIDAIENYQNTIYTEKISVTISKADPTITKLPRGIMVNYSGQPYELIIAGEVDGGTMEYSTDNVNFSTSIPTGTNAKGYNVYYRVIGDDNHNDISSTWLYSEICKSYPSIVSPKAKTLEYNGSEQELVTAGTTSNGIFYYSLDGQTWSTSVPKAKDVKEYTVYWKLVTDSNYYGVNSSTLYSEITIGTQSVPTGLTVVNESFVGKCDGEIHGLTTAMEYSLDGGLTWNKVLYPSMTFAPGEVVVRYAATEGYKASDAVSLTIGTGDYLYINNEDVDGVTIESDYDFDMVVYGDDVTFEVVIADGYKKTDSFKVSANGVEITPNADGSYTIENVVDDQYITVEGVEAYENVDISSTIYCKASYQAYLIEPWAMRITVRFTDAGGTTIKVEDMQDYGAYAIRAGELDDLTDVTISDIINNSAATKVTKSSVEGTGMWATGDGRATFGFDDGLFTYRMSEEVYWVAYCVDANGETHYMAYKTKSLHAIAESLVAASSTNTYIKAILEDMLVMEEAIVDYRSDFDNLTDLEESNPATVGTCGINFGLATSDGKYAFGNNYRVSLIEPWSIRLMTRIYDTTDADTSSTDHIDYDAVDDYGIIVYQDIDGTHGNMSNYADLLAIDGAYVYSKSQGNMGIDPDDSFRVSASYDKDIFTYQLDKNIYSVAFVKIDGKFYYSKLLTRNMLTFMSDSLASNSGSEKLLKVYDAMIEMYESVKAYHETF